MREAPSVWIDAQSRNMALTHLGMNARVFSCAPPTALRPVIRWPPPKANEAETCQNAIYRTALIEEWWNDTNVIPLTNRPFDESADLVVYGNAATALRDGTDLTYVQFRRFKDSAYEPGYDVCAGAIGRFEGVDVPDGYVLCRAEFRVRAFTPWFFGVYFHIGGSDMPHEDPFSPEWGVVGDGSPTPPLYYHYEPVNQWAWHRFAVKDPWLPPLAEPHVPSLTDISNGQVFTAMVYDAVDVLAWLEPPTWAMWQWMNISRIELLYVFTPAL
jgi:hypothetical protein